MIGSIISGVAGIASGIAGGIKAGKARKNVINSINEEKSFNQSLFDKEYNTNAMDRSDNAFLINNLRKMLNDQTNRTQATAAITGATPEAMMAQKEQANDVLANTAGNISQMNSQYKDNVMNRYLGQRQNLANQMQGMYSQEAQGWSNFMQNGLGAVSGAAAGLDGILKK